jgi:cobaltochelatase CobN
MNDAVPGRAALTADLAGSWAKLRRTPAAERRIALVLANYPHRDGRIGNGAGLDTPASIIEALRGLKAAGYRVEDIPEDGDALTARLRAAIRDRDTDETFPRSDYASVFASLPLEAQEAVTARWGAPERDPLFRESRLDCGAFVISAIRCGNIIVVLEPARGYDIDRPESVYHAPDLPPPHGYLAFYAWLNDAVRPHAVVHFGKHGDLEWLPGAAVPLSAACFADALLAVANAH